MTPPATAATRSTGRSATRRATVRHPRRISGPGGPARSGVAAAVAVPAPGIPLPRRRLRPAVQPRRRPTRKTARRSHQQAPGIALRTVGAFEAISAGALLDRLIRGRVWIGLLAFALMGIVTMQLLVLQLNTGIGHTLVRMAALQRQNAQLGIEDSMYSAENRVAPLASAAGMALAPADAVHFVATNPADISKAARALSTSVTPTSRSPESTGLGGEASVGSSSAATSTAGGETPSSTESSSSSSSTGSGEGRAESSEPTSSTHVGSETPATAASPSVPSSTPSATSSPETAPQASGASVAPSSASETSASGGGVQAAPGR